MFFRGEAVSEEAELNPPLPECYRLLVKIISRGCPAACAKIKKALPLQDFFVISYNIGVLFYANIAVTIAPTASKTKRPTIIVISSFPVSPY